MCECMQAGSCRPQTATVVNDRAPLKQAVMMQRVNAPCHQNWISREGRLLLRRVDARQAARLRGVGTRQAARLRGVVARQARLRCWQAGLLLTRNVGQDWLLLPLRGELLRDGWLRAGLRDGSARQHRPRRRPQGFRRRR